MKKKIPKIILILSFSPYVFLLGYGIYSAIFGFGFLFSASYSYGFNAFFNSVVIMGFLLCIYPVIPVCLIYQLVYLAVFIMKKRNISKKSIWLISGIIAVVLVFVAVLIYCNI